MALTHLIDTSVATRIAVPPVQARLRGATRLKEIGRTPLTDLEIGFSARNADEWDQFSTALGAFPAVAIEQADLEDALDVQRRLAAKGRRGRKIPDLIIAAAGHRLDLVILHYDADFELIAEETGQRCEWVVPRGSID